MEKNNSKIIEFEGIMSGDCECFCFDVDMDTFVKVTGKKPVAEFDRSHFNNGLFRLYPNHIFGFRSLKDKEKKMSIRVEVRENEKETHD